MRRAVLGDGVVIRSTAGQRQTARHLQVHVVRGQDPPAGALKNMYTIRSARLTKAKKGKLAITKNQFDFHPLYKETQP